MKWNVAICDDDQTICSTVNKYLKIIGDETGEEFCTDIYFSAEELLENFNIDTDILLLDICMNEITGMDAARELRKKGSKVTIIFITAMTQYAIEGYEVHAYGFMAKPLQFSAFRRQILDVMAARSREQGTDIEISCSSDIHIINTNQIMYAEVYGHSTHLLLSDGQTVSSSVSLSELEERLTKEGFFRCHKSFLVNMKKITRITLDTIELSNACTIPLSKHRRKDFLIAFARIREDLL